MYRLSDPRVEGVSFADDTAESAVWAGLGVWSLVSYTPCIGSSNFFSVTYTFYVIYYLQT